MLEAAFWAIVIAISGLVIKTLVTWPQRKQLRLASEALASLRSPKVVYYTTKIVSAVTGETISFRDGWSSTDRVGALINLGRQRFEIVAMDQPKMSSGESETVLTVKPVSDRAAA